MRANDENRGDPMAFHLRCAETGNDCPAEFTTPTEDEMLEHVKLHVRTVHPDMPLDEQTVAQVKGLVRPA